MALTRWVLDVRRDFCVVAICEDGQVRVAGRVPSTPQGLELPANGPAPDEAGPCVVCERAPPDAWRERGEDDGRARHRFRLRGTHDSGGESGAAAAPFRNR